MDDFTEDERAEYEALVRRELMLLRAKQEATAIFQKEAEMKKLQEMEEAMNSHADEEKTIGYIGGWAVGKVPVIITALIEDNSLTTLNREDVIHPETAEYHARAVKVLKIEDEVGNRYRKANSTLREDGLTFIYNTVTEDENFLITEDGRLEQVFVEDKALYSSAKPGMCFYLDRSVAEMKHFYSVTSYDRMKYGVPRKFPPKGPSIVWKANGVKLSEVMIDSNGMQGVFEQWYDNGQLWRKCHYTNGVKVGVEQAWYANGQKSEEANYVEGKLTVLREAWHENGQKRLEEHWDDGKQVGLCQAWHANGQIQKVVNYVEGKPEGLWQEWYEDGQKEREVDYVKGKAEGSYLEWHPTGEKRVEVMYKEGEKVGVEHHWYANGQLAYEATYVNGKIEGVQKTWHENGKPKSLSHYKKGIQEGLYEEWYDNGKKKREETYVDGEKEGFYTIWTLGGEKFTHYEYPKYRSKKKPLRV